MTDIASLYETPGYEDPANFADIPFEFQFPDLSEEGVVEDIFESGVLEFGFGFLDSEDGAWFDQSLPSWVTDLAVDVANELSLEIDAEAAENTMVITLSGEETEDDLQEIIEGFETTFTKAVQNAIQTSATNFP